MTEPSPHFPPSQLRVLGPCPGLYRVRPGPSASSHPETAKEATAPHRAPDPLLLPPGKPFAILCLLALEPGGLRREDLVSYLWAASPSDRARASLRQALHVVRKALTLGQVEEGIPDRTETSLGRGTRALRNEEVQGPIVEVNGRLYLPSGTVASDLEELGAALADDRLEDAYALWQGGPFAHFSLADAPAFNDWADEVRTRWERRLGEALLLRGNSERTAARDDEALAWLGRALDVRPFDEEAHALRAEILLEKGRLDDAQAALEWARRVVDEPTPGLLDGLEARLRSLRRAKAQDSGEHPTPTPSLVYVGRTSEMAELRALWRSALSGRPRSVAILGEAGIGKSRLAEEWLRHTVGPEAVVVRAKAFDTERTIPLGLVAELAKGLAAKPGAAGISNVSQSVLAHLVPTLANGRTPPPAPAFSEVAVAEALLDLAEAVANEGTLVLLLEDFQWTDPQSRAVLLRMARSLRGVPVLTVLTCRSGDSDLSAVRALRAEAAQGRFRTLELGPLSAQEVHESLAMSLEIRPPGEAARISERLARASNGNPLFLQEVIAQLHADGHIVRQDGHWVLDAGALGDNIPLPGSVQEILEARLRQIPEAHHALLGVLAHADLPLTEEEAAGRLGLKPEAGLPGGRERGEGIPLALKQLVATGVLQRDEADRYLFVHDSLQQAARRLFPPPAVPRRRRSGLRPRWTWAAAVLGLAALAFPWLRPPALPLYPGVIYFVSDGSLHRYRLPARRGDPWPALPPIPLPQDLLRAVLLPRPDGRLDLYGEVVRPGSGGVPTPVQITPAGQRRPLLEHPWDLNLSGFSPDGRYVLLSMADESEGRYRVRMVRYDQATGDTLLYESGAERMGGRWTFDGSAIVAAAWAAEDTLILFRPDGVRLGQRVVGKEYLYPPKPCGPSADRLLGVRWVPGGLALEFSGWDDSPPVVLPPFRFPISPEPLCSPDGRAAATAASINGRLRLLVFDLASGDTLLGPTMAGTGGVYWIPDRPFPVPAAVEAMDSILTLGWGDVRPLVALVHLADGTTRDDFPVSWTSLDPAVATAREGVVYANGMGVARLVVSAQGWLSDTVLVRVTGSSLAPGALLADPLTPFDTTTWEVFGSPPPVVVRTPEGPALNMNGDGIAADGFFSRRRFDLARGATLELSFQLPLTRTDRQSLTICLCAGPTPTEGGPAFNPTDTESLCFRYPSHESPRFDPSAVVIAGFGVAPPPVQVPTLPTSDWVRMALVLTPDGEGRVFLNQEKAAQLPFPLPKTPEQRWYIFLQGRAADTRLLVRDLVLWEGVRY